MKFSTEVDKNKREHVSEQKFQSQKINELVFIILEA